MAEIELRPESSRASSWMMLVLVSGFALVVMVPLALVFAAVLGPFGLGFVFLLCAGALGMMWTGWERHKRAMNQPKPVLTLDTAKIVPGKPVTIGWRFEDGAERVKSVKLEAIARETIVHNMPNEGTKERHDALRHSIGFGSGPTGGGQLVLPARAMPTFRAGVIRLDWRIEMSGMTDDGPLDQRFEIEVHPC